MRSLEPYLQKDLQEKFVFLSGPRQVGKTYLSEQLITRLQGSYYNWDFSEDRQEILHKNFLNKKFIVLDEVHKYDRWKSFIKGIYDKYHKSLKILVTGSARLDVYRKGGDSLLGRYYLYHLHPFSLGELLSPQRIPKPEKALENISLKSQSSTFEQLYQFGGFPEPFFKASEEAHLRWSNQRRELLIQQDLRDLTNVSLLSLVEHLYLLLPSRVGSVLSVNSLKEDLKVAYNTVISWLDIFERLFLTYTLKPYTKKNSRSVFKEKKIYLWDWSQIKEEGARFENFVASHLWKAVQTWRDLGFGNFELSFIRDRDRREVDFCILKDSLPWLLVEAKLSETQISESLHYYCEKFQVPGIQLVLKAGLRKQEGRINLLSAESWLAALP